MPCLDLHMHIANAMIPTDLGNRLPKRMGTKSVSKYNYFSILNIFGQQSLQIAYWAFETV